MDADFVTRERDRLLRELVEFLSIPSISTLPDHAADCRRAAEWVMGQLRDLGCPVVELLEGPGHPVVWGETAPVEGAPTLLVYGHYDVQPPEPLGLWTSPPFDPEVREAYSADDD